MKRKAEAQTAAQKPTKKKTKPCKLAIRSCYEHSMLTATLQP